MNAWTGIMTVAWLMVIAWQLDNVVYLLKKILAALTQEDPCPKKPES